MWRNCALLTIKLDQAVLAFNEERQERSSNCGNKVLLKKCCLHGHYAQGGKTRGDHKTADHVMDMGYQEKYIPFDLVGKNSGNST